MENYNKFSGSSQYDYDGSKTGPLTDIVVALQDLTSPARSAAKSMMSYLFVGFTWLSEIPSISRTVNTREDVRTADERLMRMLQKIGNRFLGAYVPYREGSENSLYINFNPTSDTYYHDNDVGFYQSSMKSIERYFIAISYIMDYPDIPWRS